MQPRCATPTVRPRPDTGGIVALSEALAEYPDARLVIYHRVSTHHQAGAGNVDLFAKTAALATEIDAIAPDRLVGVARGVEEGRVSNRRPALLRAVALARSLGRRTGRPVVIVAADLSRLIRAESYSRRTARDAVPSAEEFAELRALTGGVPLATVLDPAAPESVRHSRATRRTGRCGRHSPLTSDLKRQILRLVGKPRKKANGRTAWERPLSAVARECGVTKSQVQRFLDSPVPVAVAFRPGDRWKDAPDPLRSYDEARLRQTIDEPTGDEPVVPERTQRPDHTTDVTSAPPTPAVPVQAPPRPGGPVRDTRPRDGRFLPPDDGAYRNVHSTHTAPRSETVCPRPQYRHAPESDPRALTDDADTGGTPGTAPAGSGHFQPARSRPSPTVRRG